MSNRVGACSKCGETHELEEAMGDQLCENCMDSWMNYLIDQWSAAGGTSTSPAVTFTDPLYGAGVMEPFNGYPVVAPKYGRRNCAVLGACPGYDVEPCECRH